jgi:putative addiction module component (TIGR02574 family)
VFRITAKQQPAGARIRARELGCRIEKVRSEVLMLSEADRAELAHALVTSLDAPADADATEAWDQEIRRRLAEIDAGTAKLIDRDEFRRRMRERLGSR